MRDLTKTFPGATEVARAGEVGRRKARDIFREKKPFGRSARKEESHEKTMGKEILEMGKFYSLQNRTGFTLPASEVRVFYRGLSLGLTHPLASQPGPAGLTTPVGSV